MKQFVTLFYIIVACQAAHAFSLSTHEIYPVGSNSNGVQILFNGPTYNPPLQMRGTNVSIDRSSPEALMESVFRAYRLMNTQLYFILYGTNEARISLDPDPLLSATNMALLQRINYGSYNIMIASIKGTNYETVGPLVTKSDGTNYYLCDDLRGFVSNSNYTVVDPAYEFIENTFIQTSITHVAFPLWTNIISGRYVITTNFAGGGTTPPVILIAARGTNYLSGRPINLVVIETNQDLSTPETALDAVYSAAKANNPSWYTNLIVTSELDVQLNDPSAGCDTIRQCVAPRLNSLTNQLDHNFVITSKFQYGPYAILSTTFDDAPTGTARDWFVFKNVGNIWLLTNEMNDGDVVVAYLLGFNSLFSPPAGKVFPAPQ